MNGKELRLKQEYFLTSASVKNAVHEFNKRDLPLKGIEECCPEDLSEVGVYLLVEDALNDDITDEKKIPHNYYYTTG